MALEKFVIQGGKRLRGTVAVSGSKNSALPVMAACLAGEGTLTLHNVPNLADIQSMCELLTDVGVRVDRTTDGRIALHVADEGKTHADYERVRKMRASVCVLGPLLAKRRKARVAMPGGCQIGPRPIDLHLRGLQALGATIELDSGDIVATAKRLRGAHVFLGGAFGSTVLGTANVLTAAVLAEGQTVIESAACEPEIEDLAACLTAMGARIRGAGTPRIVIDGVETLGSAEHRLIPDRIEAGTLMMAAAATNGEVTLQNVRLDHLAAVVHKLREVGVNVETSNGGAVISSARRLQPTDVCTLPYPGFPTDLQAQMMVLLCLADGNSAITEKVFPDRFIHVAELLRMGADIRKEGPTAIVTGVKHLVGAPVMASDLRASAALVLAGLAARGTTHVSRVYHLDRGYEQFECKLRALSADIQRAEQGPTAAE